MIFTGLMIMVGDQIINWVLESFTVECAYEILINLVGYGYMLLVFWIFGCLFRFVRIFIMVMFRTSVSDLYGFPVIFMFGILRSEVGDWTAMEHLQTAYRYDV